MPLPKRLPDAADGTLRFEVDLSRGGNARELKAKTLTLTLVERRRRDGGHLDGAVAGYVSRHYRLASRRQAPKLAARVAAMRTRVNFNSQSAKPSLKGSAL